MKRMLLAFAAILISATMFAQSATGKKAEDLIKFKEMSYNFGKIKQGVPVTHDFQFTNVSAKPVIIESATASCGCTTPVKPEPPVGKGKTDKITAGFNAAAVGPFNKSIYVKVAGVDAPVELKITGEVVAENSSAKQ
jgi:hypothetical protein